MLTWYKGQACSKHFLWMTTESMMWVLSLMVNETKAQSLRNLQKGGQSCDWNPSSLKWQRP